jgi:hypothetical protein
MEKVLRSGGVESVTFEIGRPLREECCDSLLIVVAVVNLAAK